jgi:hypothetical protein
MEVLVLPLDVVYSAALQLLAAQATALMPRRLCQMRVSLRGRDQRHDVALWTRNDQES